MRDHYTDGSLKAHDGPSYKAIRNHYNEVGNLQQDKRGDSATWIYYGFMILDVFQRAFQSPRL